MNFLSLFAVLTALDVVAVISARFFLVNKQERYRLLSVLSFGVSVVFFRALMAYETTAIVNILWASLSSIVVAIACVFLFGEKINRFQALGIVLILVGMGLL